MTASRGVTNNVALSLELVGLVGGDVERERLAWQLDGIDELRQLVLREIGDADLRRKASRVSGVGRQFAGCGHYMNGSISALCQGELSCGFASEFNCSRFT